MSISFQGIGQVCATFLCDAAAEGQPVKVSGRGAVSPCGDGEEFCGVVLCGKDDACTVQVAGFATVRYTGETPAMGWTALAADGEGGVKSVSTGGRTLLVADADATAGTVTILL